MKIEQTYEVVRIDGDHDPLKEHPQNPNIGDDDVVDESVETNGWYGAIIAQKTTGYILAGNTRYRVAKRNGAAEIPVIWKDVDDEAALRILLVDNQSARRAEMDEEKLTLLLEGLDSLTGTGFDDVLHPLERAIEEEREGSDDEGPLAIPPDGDEPSTPSAPGGRIPVGSAVPADKYTPSWGIMVVCTSEEDQEWVHEQILEILPGHTLQVVAV